MATRTLRVVAFATSALAIVGLAGCAGGGSPTGDVVKINIIAPSNAPSDAGFQAVTDAFNASQTGIEATFSPVTDYETTRAAQLSAGTVDVFVCYPRQPQGFTDEESTEDMLMAQAGQFVDLTDKPFMGNYIQSVLASPRSTMNGKLYAVPTGLSYATGVYYNKKIFSTLGLAIPTTWGEFTATMAALKAAGVTPFGFGGKDGFPAALPLYGIIGSLYPEDANKQALLKGLWDGSVDLTRGVPLEAMQRLQTIYDNTSAASPGSSIVESIGAFANGEFAMMFDGSWDQKSVTDVVGGKFDFGMFPLPGADNADQNRFLNGKIELQLCASSASAHQDAALAWLDFFSQPKNYTTFAKLSGFAPAQPNIVTDDPFLDSISQYASDFRLFWESIVVAPQAIAPEAKVGFEYNRLPPLGTNTPAEAAAAAQAAWDAVR